MTLLLSCLRCSHSWLRRNLTSEPKFCPRCHSPYWNRQRKAQGNPRTSAQEKGE
jgi:hypothetical protein